MATKGKIDELYDLTSIDAQHAKVMANIQDLLKAVNEFKPISIKLEGAEKTKDIVDGMNEMAKGAKVFAETSAAAVNEHGKLIDLAKKAGPSFENQKKILDALGGSLDQNIKLQVQYKIRLAEIQAEMKLMAKETNDLAKNSEDYKNKVAELTREQLELKNASSELAATIKQQIKENQSAESSMDQLQARVTQLQNAYESLSEEERKGEIGKSLKAAIDELEPKIKEQEADIGKFQRNVGNYSQAIQVLEKALTDVSKKIEQYNKDGTASAEMMNTLIKEQDLLNKLLNNQSQGFLTATAEIRENTKALQQMEAANLKGTDAYKQLFAATAELKDETADLKAALTNAAPDDVAFNAAADAARGLIGVYGLAKSVSAAFGVENEALEETLVKLQAAETALQSIEAIRAVFKKENAVRQAISIGLQKVEILQTNLQTAAESKNIVVKYLAIGAQKALNAVMNQAGGPLLAIIGLISLLVISLASFASATDKAQKSFLKLNAEFEANARLTEDSLKAISNAGDKIVAEMEASFATEKSIREKRTQFLEQQLAKQTAFNDKERANYERADAYVRRHIKDFDDLSKSEQEQYNEAVKITENYNKSQEKQFDLEHELDLQRIANRKADAQEMIKAQQDYAEASKIDLQSAGTKLQSVIGDERKSYADRIAALQEFQKIQVALINKDASAKRIDPTLSPSEIRVIETQRRAAILQSVQETNKQVEVLRRESLERQKKAQYDIARTSIELQQSAAQEVLSNQHASDEDRLFAALQYQKATEALIIGQRNEELRNTKLTAEERKAIEVKANADIIASKRGFNKTVQDLLVESLDEEAQKRLAASNKERDDSIAALNDRYNAGKLSLVQYNKERLDLEKGYSIESLQIAIESAEKEIALYKSLGFDVAQSEAKLAELKKNLSDEVTNKKIADLEKLKEKEKELANEIIDAVEAVATASITKKQNEIQTRIDLIDKNKEKEIEAANATIVNEQEKANAIAVINARAQAQKETLELRQRQLEYEKAKVERAFTIGRIIADTAAAVVAALGSKPWTPANIALAAVTGAIGAAQLVKVLATPLPKFAEGTEDSPEGWAWVGDGNKRERIIHPDGTTYISDDKPQLVYLPRHSQVKADAEAFDRDAHDVLRLGVLKSLQLPSNDHRQQQFQDQFLRAYTRQSVRIVKAIQNQPRPVIQHSWNGWTLGWQDGQKWDNYVKASI